jgi:hypothetical protein
MGPRLLHLAVGAALALSGCGADRPATGPAPSPSGSALLDAGDLPDGYATSPPQAAPEVSAASRVSVEGCGALLEYFRDGGGDAGDGPAVRFEAGGTGPFLAESLSRAGASPGTGGSPLSARADRCASFTDTDADGATTTVRVQPVGDFPRLGDAEDVVEMSANGGTGDEAFVMSGYILVVRVKNVTCTLVHFGQPGVERAETEAIARAAVAKVGKRQ